MDPNAFMDRVFSRRPRNVSAFSFQSWSHGGKPTSEGVGFLPAPGVDPDKFVACVLDLDHYVGNVDFVVESRTIADPTCSPPESIHFYERIKVPVLAEIQMEMVMRDLGEREGFRVLCWSQLDDATARLDKRKGARSAYNVGAWLVKPGVVGYALCSAPRKEDVGRLKFAALTRGADAGAGKMVRANIAGMIAWSKRR